MKTKMRLALALALGAAPLGCTRYEANDLEILTTYSAKQLCSCLFVMKRSEAYCTEWAREEPDVKTFTIDYEQKRVKTQAMTLWGGGAHWVDARRGCVAE